MTYPDGIDALVNVNAGDTLAAGGHAARHNSVNTALDEVKDLLNAGDAGEVLTAAGSAAPPVWAPVAAGGKILQIVRAADGTSRSTTSTAFTDASLSVTITPQRNDSALLLVWTALVTIDNATNNECRAVLSITNSSNVAVGGAQQGTTGTVNMTGTGTRGFRDSIAMIGYTTPATTSAVTYKIRFRAVDANATLALANSNQTGQFFAIEVSA
jgi:hypothetical protein